MVRTKRARRAATGTGTERIETPPVAKAGPARGCRGKSRGKMRAFGGADKAGGHTGGRRAAGRRVTGRARTGHERAHPDGDRARGAAMRARVRRAR